MDNKVLPLKQPAKRETGQLSKPITHLRITFNATRSNVCSLGSRILSPYSLLYKYVSPGLQDYLEQSCCIPCIVAVASRRPLGYCQCFPSAFQWEVVSVTLF